MSAKLLHALTDDNPDLQKQIGCMTGIFQLFDRHHFVSTRRLYAQQHKRLPSDHPHFRQSNCKVEAEAIAGSPRVSVEKNLIHNQHANIDLSVVSGSSSSCSSSFSSVEFSRTAPSEPSSLDRPLRNAQKSCTSSVDNKHTISSASSQQAHSYTGRQSLDFRDIVKDSMYRDTQRLSVKTRTKEADVNHLTKPRDSPRPLQVPKLLDESPVKHISGKPKVPADLNESLRVLARLKEGPWYLSESRDSPRASHEVKDASWYSVTKEGRRFSYDGKEIPRASCDSRDNYKSMAKLKELPRLSLDERDCSSRSSNFDIISSSTLKDLQNHSNQKIGDNRQRPGIVAKLMGLEPISNSSSSGKPIHELETRLDRVLCSPRNSLIDPVSPQARKTDLVKKQASNSRVPIEAAPWRHLEGGLGSPRKAAKAHLPAKTQAPDFVFTEIERRLKELKFQHSEKDLRALLDAVQAKVLLDTKKDQVRTQQLQAPETYSNQVSSVEPVNRRMPQHDNPISLPTRGSCSPKSYESPIVIMRPVKPSDKSNINPSSFINSNGFTYPQGNKLTRDLKTPREIDGNRGSSRVQGLPSKISTRETANQSQGSANRKVNSRTEGNLRRPQKPQPRFTQLPTRPQEVTRDTRSTKNSGSLSPRLQQGKQEERKTRQPNYSQDSSKLRKQSGRRQQSDIRCKVNKRISDLDCSIEDHASDKSSDTGRYLNHQSNEASTRSDSNISSASHFDVEVTSVDRSSEMNSVFQKSSVSNLEEKIQGASSTLKDESGFLELGGLGPEQPSPVSVLDHSFYKDDLPSPVKTTHPFKGKEIWKPCTNNRLSNTRRSLDFSSIKGNHNKFTNVEHLVQRLQRLNSSHDEAATDYIASLCEKTTPEHRYISEILLASGFLLKDLTSDIIVTHIDPCSSGFLINQDLFFVLEKTKASRLYKEEASKPGLPIQQKADHERVQRRLLFDTVNEVLISKLPVIDSEPWLGVPVLAKKVATGQRLLHEVCAEIDQIASNNYGNFDDMLNHLMCRLENWSDQQNDISTVVLDIERMIFKDLVDEIVNRDEWHFRVGKQTRGHQSKAQWFPRGVLQAVMFAFSFS
ncbi:protein LONGIFOLIA 1-like isoform X2 [Nymphaea colorata]|uniref:protein LONGIFOLIA 1-like isoform X2 n=1 Tax=Nymphaea colorata TaxID=210225 RepID=UPI00129EFDE4|nr:protein LONGIFOLIA 1-like isoform X2 [Nymphaea colorata]